MPPRAEFDGIDCALSASALTPAIVPSSKPKSKSFERRRRPGVVFRTTHGISGVLSTLLTISAIATQRTLPPKSVLSSVTSVLAAVVSIVTAVSGTSIVDQAPKQTVVMERPIRVVPPHRDAFRRTALSVYYLGARICWNAATTHRSLVLGDISKAGENAYSFDWVWGCIALYYAMKCFVPRQGEVDWTNGNTYVFVVPMALGLSSDALCQLPILQCRGDMCWNVDIITQFDLLCVLLSGLVVAFTFTLAFRGVLGIRSCYWGAALVVHGIVICLIIKALPFAIMQLTSRLT
mmetsp:Transcript_15551/g.33924  ORF Transcript_15551/g.33924 Transcript_15551/m.33924 type:complete len:292 (+) Transcript_15551:47-922(+)